VLNGSPGDHVHGTTGKVWRNRNGDELPEGKLTRKRENH